MRIVRALVGRHGAARLPSGKLRREPRVWQSGYLLLRSLTSQLRTNVALRFDGRDGIDVVDIGCGSRPYEEIFHPYARSYVGVDVVRAPTVDVVANAESLPFEGGSFDCVVCTQVLEHVGDPAAVTSEIFRVLRPDGVGFISTHGVAPYHATPELNVEDYWRWTHAGLEQLLRTTGRWAEVRVVPNGATGSALAYLMGRELEIVASKLRLPIVAAPLVIVGNTTAWSLDQVFWRLFPSRPPDLAPNYLAVAVR
jgi:SAM-dependent methyltransferase